MTKLAKYEAARKALTEAVMFDEVMNIRNVAEQAALYAKQANDTDLIQKATEIKVRAERKAGEMLRKAAEQGQRATPNGNVNPATIKVSNETTPSPVTLAEIGITRDQSSRYQKLAAMPDEHFETAVETAKASAGEVTTAFMLREAAKHRSEPIKTKKAEAYRQELKEAKDRGVSMLLSHGRLFLRTLQMQDSFSSQERELLAEIEGAISLELSHERN